MGILTDFWRTIDGTIHPEDRPVFDTWHHERGSRPFNLDFPPPAFWGDVDKASVIVLYNNGGYNDDNSRADKRTSREYADKRKIELHINYLKTAGPVCAGEFSPYYENNILHDQVASGKVAWVNAVAYRSKNASSPELRELADRLPSVQASRNWLRDEVVPAAKAGERLLVFHRWGLWKVDPKQFDSPNILFSKSARPANISIEMNERIKNFLAQRD